jgi:hypothetical protein
VSPITLNNTLLSKVTIYYPFHPLLGGNFEIVAIPRRPDLPVTVRGADGTDIKIPRWMTEPAAADIAILSPAVVAVEALRVVYRLLSDHNHLFPSRSFADPSLQGKTPKPEGSDGANDIRNDACGKRARRGSGRQSRPGDRRSLGEVDGTRNGRRRSQRKGGKR